MPANMTPQQLAAYRAQQAARAQAARAQAAAPQGAPQGRPASPAAPVDPAANRCHLIARTPVFDAHRVVQMYRLRFSSGNKFVTDRILPQHVASIVNDYFIERSMK